MFRAILLTQWKWTRALVLAATVLGFIMPLLAYSYAREAGSAREFIGAMQRWGSGYSLLAAALGLLVALAAWQPDQQGRHVYALTLPVPRARYAAMRFGAGALFLLPAVVALLLGGVVVAVTGTIPDGLHAYPVALALRFAFAAAVAFAIFFAIASSTARTAAIIMATIAGVVFAQYLLSVIGSRIDILQPIFNFIFVRPGILSVFSGRWMLVDV